MGKKLKVFALFCLPYIKQFGFRVIFIASLSTILIYYDFQHIPQQVPVTRSETITMNKPFGQTPTNPSQTNNQNVPNSNTLLQYAFQEVKVTTTTEDFKKLFFTGTNLFWITIFGKILLAILAYFVILLPFRKFESLEFGGFKYKVQAEKQEEIADSEIKTVQADEQKRLSFLYTLVTNVDVFKALSSFVTSYNTFNQYKVTEYLASLLYTTFDHFSYIGVISVDNGNLNQSQMATIEQKISQVIHQSFNLRQKYLDDSQGIYFAVPFLFEETDEDFTILYGSASNSITESDLLMISTVWNIVTYQLDLAMSLYQSQTETGS